MLKKSKINIIDKNYFVKNKARHENIFNNVTHFYHISINGSSLEAKHILVGPKSKWKWENTWKFTETYFTFTPLKQTHIKRILNKTVILFTNSIRGK